MIFTAPEEWLYIDRDWGRLNTHIKTRPFSAFVSVHQASFKLFNQLSKRVDKRIKYIWEHSRGLLTSMKEKQNKRRQTKGLKTKGKVKGKSEERGITEEVTSLVRDSKQNKNKTWNRSGLWSRSGGTTPALPLPKILPLPIFLTPPFSKRTREEMLDETFFPLPKLCLPWVLSSFVISHTHTTIFSMPPSYSIFSPWTPPPLMPDTTTSAACGLNGNQTLTHSSLHCSLFLLYTKLASVSLKRSKRWTCFYGFTLHRSSWYGQTFSSH